MATVVPGAGQVMEGAAGPVGGEGPDPADGFQIAMSAAGTSVWPGGLPARPATPRTGLSDWREPLAWLGAGLAVISGVSLFNGRQRRRRGWRMLPARLTAEEWLWS